jgi:glycosyltransferase involved in cell wall biosynthesis
MDAAAPNLARLRVVEFVPSLWHGGAELVAVSLASALDDRVERLVIASSGGDPYTEQIRAAGISLEIVPRPWPRPVPIVRSAIALARVLRRERPQVIHAHNPGASAAAWLARRLALMPRIAIVTTYHGVIPARLARANRALAFFSDLVVGVAPSVTRMLIERGLPAERTTTIFNAVEAEVRRPHTEVRAEFGVPEGVPLIVSVGRYVEEKNQALLIDALARLQRPFKALVAGYGELESDLQAQIEAAGLEQDVILTGRREDVADLTGAADVFVLSSDWEALPLVVLEALHLETPVVTTDAGAIADVIDAQTGVLVGRGDANALAAGIERVLGDPDLAARLAAAGRAFVLEHCSLDHMVDAYSAAFTDAINRRAGAMPSR